MVKTPHWPEIMGYKPIDLGLTRIREVVKKLGIDEKKLPPVIHVAGTNGKGSTIAFMKAIFEAAGCSVHCYTSPHLVEFNERIALNGKQIDDDYLHDVLERTKIAAEDIKLTFFEGTTAAAFLAFSEKKADVLLLETGLGGRLDATNILEKPLLTVITPISKDHMEFLGNSIEEIAKEKAAIMKPGVSCVVAKQLPEALEIIQKNGETICYGKDWKIEDLIFEMGDKKIELPEPTMTGEFQIMNAGTAIAAVLTQKKLKVSDENIRDGIKNARWPGRLQKIESGKLKEGISSDLYIDGTHNIGGAVELKKWINSNPDKKFYGIVGMLKSKNIDEFFNELKGCFAEIVAIEIPGEKSYNCDEIKNSARKFGITTTGYDSLDQALQHFKNLKNGRVIITGSLYLAGYALEQNGISGIE